MRVNTEESIRLGERIYRRFGSWEAVRQASRLRDDGVYVVPAEDEGADGPEESGAAA